MLSRPRPGQPVHLRYGKRYRRFAGDLPDRAGSVVAVATGRRWSHGETLRSLYRLPPVRWSAAMEGKGRNGPLNHGILVDGRLVVVPCGQLNSLKD